MSRGTQIVALSACVVICGCGNSVQLGPTLASDAGIDSAVAPIPTSGFAELLAFDPTRYEFDFIHADYGEVPNMPGAVWSPGPQLEYSHYLQGELTVAFLGAEVGSILDLGTDGEVAKGLGIDESLSDGEGYAHLAFSGGHFNLQNAEALVDDSSLSAESHALPGNGHVYVMRVVDSNLPPPGDLVVKLLVVSVNDQNDVSFEWTRLR